MFDLFIQLRKIIYLFFLTALILSCSTQNRNEEKYTDDEINLFIRLALGYPQAYSEKNSILKWDKETVRVVTRGQLTLEDKENLRELLQELNELSRYSQFVQKKENPDIEIYFAELQLFKDIFWRETVKGWKNRSWGTFYRMYNEDGGLKKVQIAIPNELSSNSIRRTSLRSLFIRSLGLSYNIGTNYNDRFKKSIFVKYYRQRRQHLVEWEKQLIRMILDPDIQPGMNLQQVEEILRS